MKDFDDIIAPLLLKIYRVYTIDRFNPKKQRKPYKSRKNKPVITPLGRFESGQQAAIAHGVSRSTMSARLRNKMKGYTFDDTKL